MKAYEVTITEVLQKTVTVKADSQEEAETSVEDGYYAEKYVLVAEDLKERYFEAKEVVRNRDLER